MANALDIELPSLKTAIQIVLVLLVVIAVVKMLPASWNIKQWFTV